MIRNKFWLMIAAGVICLSAVPAQADVKPHALFTDNMVLQQGIKVPVWGTADDGEKVTVTLQGQEQTTTAKDGKWLVRFDDLKVGGPYEMTISGNNKVELKNVLVGEVWVCSGQSNMEWPVRSSTDAQKNIENSRNPQLRLFTVPHAGTAKPQASVKGEWKECGPDAVPSFSAVAYFFGRDVQKARNVPVGLIHTSWGGTPAEAWTSRRVLESHPDLKHYLDDQAKAVANYQANQEKYKSALAKYQEQAKKAKDEGKSSPQASRPPQAPQNPMTGSHSPAALYNGMIAPLVPYAIRGAIWYQGESNAGSFPRAVEYQSLFGAMIQNWRDDWKQGDFPFLFVQLAPFMKIEKEPTDTPWAWLRESQRQVTLKVPHTAQAVIIDVGDEKDIHPKQKEPVGGRLALAALAQVYGEKIEYSGPTFREMQIDGNKAVLSFQHTGGGLVAKGDSLTGFTVAGEDKKFVNAEAKIEGDKVMVWSDKVEKPFAVRFGWANYPVVNLWNKANLPASPFRTDDFSPPGSARRSASAR